MLKKFLVLVLALCTSLAFAATDANKAGIDDLTSVKGIGPATANRIIEARKQAPFKNWADLIERVKGVADTSASKLSAAGLTVNGQSFKPQATPSPAATTEKSTKPVQASSKKDNKG